MATPAEVRAQLQLNRFVNPRDAVIRITSTAICGSDLHLYSKLGRHGLLDDEGGERHPGDHADDRLLARGRGVLGELERQGVLAVGAEGTPLRLIGDPDGV